MGGLRWKDQSLVDNDQQGTYALDTSFELCPLSSSGTKDTPIQNWRPHKLQAWVLQGACPIIGVAFFFARGIRWGPPQALGTVTTRNLTTLVPRLRQPLWWTPAFPHAASRCFTRPRIVDINALRALAPLPCAPVPRPSRPQPRSPAGAAGTAPPSLAAAQGLDAEEPAIRKGSREHRQGHQR